MLSLVLSPSDRNADTIRDGSACGAAYSAVMYNVFLIVLVSESYVSVRDVELQQFSVNFSSVINDIDCKPGKCICLQH